MPTLKINDTVGIESEKNRPARYYGTVKKIEITEAGTRVFVAFGPDEDHQPYEQHQLTRVSIGWNPPQMAGDR